MFFTGVVAASAVAFALANGVVADTCTRNYTIQEGDICDSISAANNVSTYQLAALNPSIDSTCSDLLPGVSLCLGTDSEDCTATYVVQLNDTCDSVSAAHGINTTMILTNNPQINEDCGNLYTGEVICVSDAAQVPEFQDRTSSVNASDASSSSDATSSPSPVASDSSDANDASDADEDEGDDDDEDDDDLPECED